MERLHEERGAFSGLLIQGHLYLNQHLYPTNKMRCRGRCISSWAAGQDRNLGMLTPGYEKWLLGCGKSFWCGGTGGGTMQTHHAP